MRLLQLLGLTFILLLFWSFQSKITLSDNKEAKQLIKEHEELFYNGQYEKSLTKLLEAKALYKENKNWEKVIDFLHQAYLFIDYIPNFQGENYLREALQLSDQYLPEYHKLTGETHQYLGEWYSISEKYDSSIIALKKAADIFKNIEDWKGETWTVISIASSYYYNNELDKMLASLNKAEQFAEEKQLSSDLFDAIYELYGVYYYNILDIEKSIYYNKRSIELIENISKKTDNDSFYIAILYQNQGVNYINHFNLERAAFYLSKSLNILQLLNVSIQEKMDVYINYVSVLYRLKQHHKSIAALEKIKNISKENLSEKTYTKHLNDIYNLYTKNYFALSELNNAAFYVDELMKFYENEVETPNSVLLMKSRLLFYQKDYLAAEKLLKSISLNYEKEHSTLTKGDNFQKYGIMPHAYNVLGQTLYVLDKKEEALLCFQKSLAANILDFEDINDINQPTSIQNPFRAEHVLTSLHQKAIVLETINTEKSKQQALNTYQVASKWMETMRQSMAFDASKENLNTFSDIYKNGVSLAAELYQATNKEQYLEIAFEWSEKEKAVILLDNLMGEQGKVATNVPKDILEREANLKRNITFFQQKRLELEDEKDSKNYELNEQRFTDANIQMAKLKDTLQTYYQSYFNLEYQSSIATIPTIQKDLLRPQQALIQYFTTDSLFYVFVIDKENSQLITLPKGAKENQLLEDLQVNLQQTNIANQTEQENFQSFVSLAHQGYQSILEPITSRLSADIKELVIVPDAALNYLPFEALLSEAVTSSKVDYLKLPYALNDYQFHYGYSGTLLLENQRQHKALKTNDQILAFAPPYESTNPIAQRGNMKTLRGSNVAQLKGTAKEIRAIANYFDGEFDCSPTATKANFTEQVGDFGILHLAMHGQSSLENPSDAHLVFSNLNNETNKDNLLHHYEITALETKAQLAVLSACETGVGKEIEGEGVMSLGRGFMYAGIPSIVMSLWKMNDQSTSELMPLFYKKPIGRYAKR